MIVGFSTSSPVASVALFDANWDLIDWREDLAPRAASATCLRLLELLLTSSNVNLTDVSAFGADIGPGSFTGVRVGVTLAKTLAFAQAALTFGATSFDLVSVSQVAVLPSKRNEWFIRKPGEKPHKSTEFPEMPFVGFGPGIENPVYPSASRFVKTDLLEPERLLPAYLTEPAISQPNKPFGLGESN